ncbi:MAG: TIGR03905 family TSCPD domain-containing protein [Oscillospiraceae bacterium]|nr:TIGR03905 family TSCPD domain-containing protein [Oscillospiraceae bacterium]
MKHEYKTKGTCSSKITFDLGDDKKISNIRFTDGCNGNLNGISALADGMDAETLVSKFKGTRCGRKKTSCPDQLATAIEEALAARAQAEAAAPHTKSQ